MVYTSPSAINTHEACNRKWFYKYVQRIPDDAPSRAMQYGINLHARIEHYLKTGEDILGPAERAGIDYIPVPSARLLVEKKTSEDIPLRASGVPIKGSVDLVDLLPSGGTKVFDWKSTSRLANKWTTPESLLDPTNDEGRQMLAYAEWARLNTASTWIQVGHVQFQIGSVDASGTASGPFKAKRVLSTPVGPSIIAAKWQVVEGTVERMKATAFAVRPEDVPGNLENCNKYHRPCAYIRQCPEGQIGATGAFGLLFGGTKERKVEGNMGMVDRLKAVMGDAEAAPMPGVQGVYEAVTSAIQTEASKEAKRVEGLLAIATTTPIPKPAPVPRAVVAKPPPDPNAPPKRRGRPPKIRPEEAGPEAATFSGEPLSPGNENVVVGDDLAPAVGAPFHVYFGCTPVGVFVDSLDAYVSVLETKALTAFSETLPDVRLSEKDGLKYGKYKAVLGQLAKEAPPSPGHYVVTYGDERVEAVAGALASIAAPGCVVRGGGR